MLSGLTETFQEPLPGMKIAMTPPLDLNNDAEAYATEFPFLSAILNPNSEVDTFPVKLVKFTQWFPPTPVWYTGP